MARLDRHQSEIRERQANDYQETRNEAMADGLTYMNKIDTQIELESARKHKRELEKAKKCWRGDMELFKQLDDRQTDEQKNRLTYRGVP